MTTTRGSSGLAFVLSGSFHALVAITILVLVQPSDPAATTDKEPRPFDARGLVFVMSAEQGPGGGGGGSGNEHPEPIRRAQGLGIDQATVHVMPREMPASAVDQLPLPSVALDVRPVAAGHVEQTGAIATGSSQGPSTGAGIGGHVGDGNGRGVGDGSGPGLGPGSRGGVGGGAGEPGGGVTPPRVLAEVKPLYTNEAMARRIQGTVVLEIVIDPDGRARDVRVAQSLDAGLDARAIEAVRLWRFEPGRLKDAPVAVRVRVMMDFRIR